MSILRLSVFCCQKSNACPIGRVYPCCLPKFLIACMFRSTQHLPIQSLRLLYRPYMHLHAHHAHCAKVSGVFAARLRPTSVPAATASCTQKSGITIILHATQARHWLLWGARSDRNRMYDLCLFVLCWVSGDLGCLSACHRVFFPGLGEPMNVLLFCIKLFNRVEVTTIYNNRCSSMPAVIRIFGGKVCPNRLPKDANRKHCHRDFVK